MRFSQKNNSLVMKYGVSTVIISPWGENSLRVRMTKDKKMDKNDWALTEPVIKTKSQVTISDINITEPWWYTEEEREKHAQTAKEASIVNGKIKAKVSFEGWISFYNQDDELLTKEYWRNRDRIDRYSVPLRIEAREIKPILGTTDYKLSARFEAFDDEMIFGMGQYQEGSLNKKGAILELCHRNSQASVPFYISSRGYGFLWNNPAIGTAAFGTNKTSGQRKARRNWIILLPPETHLPK